MVTPEVIVAVYTVSLARSVVGFKTATFPYTDTVLGTTFAPCVRTKVVLLIVDGLTAASKVAETDMLIGVPVSPSLGLVIVTTGPGALEGGTEVFTDVDVVVLVAGEVEELLQPTTANKTETRRIARLKYNDFFIVLPP